MPNKLDWNCKRRRVCLPE
ncbi:hypothetical protein U0070_012853 [Myodes glareolus]|uniref:Uncharacterized protein n=1 Tax=Myodes glareolus TaxID=447135 RepID=A0AAW0H7C2_MYOGA